MAIIRELKGLNQIAGQIRFIGDISGGALKLIHEAVHIGLPLWDPPPPRPPAPPDHETVARVQETIGMGTLEERRAFDKVTETWRKVKRGEPSQPAQFPGRREQTAPTPEQEKPREARP